MASSGVKVLALLAAGDVSGPCKGLYQLIEHSKDSGVAFILGMFLTPSFTTTPAIEEARRRGIHVEILSQRSRYDVNLLIQTRRLAKRHHIDVVQSHGYKAGVLGWCLKLLTGLPWVAFAHGYTRENRRIAWYNRLDSWLLRRADRVVVVSEATGRLMGSAGVSQKIIRVIPNTIDPRDHQVAADGDDFRRLCGAGPQDLLIGVIGRLSPEKGQTVFLQAFAQVVQAVRNAKAVLVGDGQDMAGLKELVGANRLEESVFFTGQLTNTAPVYAALDLVVIPSLSEGLPNVLLEAMVYQKPVIATSVGGIPEVMQNGLSKFLVPARNPKALADAIISVLREPALRTESGEAGARRVRAAFSPSQRTTQIIALYKGLLRIP